MGKLKDLEIQALMREGKAVSGRSDGDGLTFTLTARGKASWVLRYRLGGKQKEVTLGMYPDVSLKRARELALEARLKVQQGVDVAKEKRDALAAQAEAGTVKELCDEYYQRDVLKRRVPLRRPDLIRSQLDNYIIPSIGKLKLDEVRPRDIDLMLRGLVDRGVLITANRVLTVTKTVFSYAVRRHWIEYNPASAYGRRDAGGEEKPRRRALSDDEIPRLFKAFAEAGPAFRTYDLATRLLLVTAVRKSELVEAPWSEFDLGSGLWTIGVDRVKTGESSGRDFTIPLPQAAVSWFEELKRCYPTSHYVFPPKRRTGHPTMSPETLNWAIKEIGHDLDHFTLHDLRRTARTQLSRLGVEPHVAERCLNHRLPGVNDIYDTYDYLDERRAALELWASKLVALIEGRAFNVVPIRAA